MIKVNDKITVVLKADLVIRARVAEAVARFGMLKWRTARKRQHKASIGSGVVSILDEGSMWCRGWNGSAVKALRTVAALES